MGKLAPLSPLHFCPAKHSSQKGLTLLFRLAKHSSQKKDSHPSTTQPNTAHKKDSHSSTTQPNSAHKKRTHTPPLPSQTHLTQKGLTLLHYPAKLTSHKGLTLLHYQNTALKKDSHPSTTQPNTAHKKGLAHHMQGHARSQGQLP